MASSLFQPLFDIFTRRRKPAPTSTIGVPGTAVFGGYVETTENNGELTGTAQYKVYSDLLANVSIVSAGTRYFLNLIANSEWKVRPADDSEQALFYAKKIETQLKSMETSWNRIVRRSAMYRFYGFSVQEWTAAKNADGDLMFIDIAPRPQLSIERWDVDRTGKVLGIVQTSPQTGDELYLPREKTIYIVDDSLNDSPTGLGLFRHIVESCTRLIRYEQLEGFGFESDLRGIPIGRAPFAALQEAVETGLITKADKINAETPIKTFIENHIKNPALGILLDSIPYESQDEAGTPSTVRQWDVELLKGSSTSLPEMANAIERVNREIARTLGVEGLLLGSQTAGSNALSKDKSINFALIVDSTLGDLGEAYKKDLVGRLFELNGWPEEMQPSLTPDDAVHRDVTTITQALKDMAKAGASMPLNDPAVNEVRRLLGLSPQPIVTEENNTNSSAGNNDSSQSNTDDEDKEDEDE